MMGGMTATMIEVDGGTVWADDTGGDGPTLVLLHPGVGDSRIWDPVLPALAAKYRVIRYDARGFGHSPAPTATFSLLRDLVTVLDHYDVKRAAIVGCSQGGGTALGLALEQPERVPALVLLCPGIPGIPLDDDSDEGALLGAAWERAEAAGDVDGLASVTQRVWGRAGATPEAMEQFRSSARAVLATGDLEQEDPPVYERLTEIAVPTSLLVGDADFAPLIEADKAAAARIPGCELILVPGMDHLPPLRDPELVLQTITSTLARASWLSRSSVDASGSRLIRSGCHRSAWSRRWGRRARSVRTTGFDGCDLRATGARRRPGRRARRRQAAPPRPARPGRGPGRAAPTSWPARRRGPAAPTAPRCPRGTGTAAG